MVGKALLHPTLIYNHVSTGVAQGDGREGLATSHFDLQPYEYREGLATSHTDL